MSLGCLAADALDIGVGTVGVAHAEAVDALFAVDSVAVDDIGEVGFYDDIFIVHLDAAAKGAAPYALTCLAVDAAHDDAAVGPSLPVAVDDDPVAVGQGSAANGAVGIAAC